MQKHYTDLDDFEDDSRSHLLDMVEWLVPRIIVAVCAVLVIMVCAKLEAL